MVRTDILHRFEARVKANEPSGEKIHQIGATRPGKATLKGLIRMSDKYRSLSLRARAVFDALLERAGKHNPDESGNELMHCWPSRKYLAGMIARSEDFIDRGLAELRKAGLVESANHGGRCGKRNYYTLFVPREIVESMNAEAVVDPASSPQSGGLQGRESAGSNAAVLRHSLEPDSVKQTQRTTTTEAPRTQTTRAASTIVEHGGGGGGVSFSNDEMQRTKAKLRERGVGMNDQAIERMLRAGNITEAIVDAAWCEVSETANDEAAVLVTMLRSVDNVERLRAKTVEESKLIAVTNERAAFARWPEDARRFWCDKAREFYPNLASKPDHDPVIQAAAFKVYNASKARITEAIERAKTSREVIEHQGNRAGTDLITRAITIVEAVTNDPGFIAAAVEVVTIADTGERFKALAKLAWFWTGEVESVESTEGVASC